MLKRKLVTRSKLTKIISFSSIKCGELMYCESTLERDRLLHLEFDNEVTYYEAQPDTFPYEMDSGRTSEYTPDICVHRGDQSHIEEIKPDKLYQKPKTFRKYAAINRMFLMKGTDFRIITDVDIYSGYNVQNYLFLYRFLGEPIPHSLLNKFQSEFASFHCSLCEIRALLSEKKFPVYTSNLLLAHGYIKFNHKKPINPDLEVYAA